MGKLRRGSKPGMGQEIPLSGDRERELDLLGLGYYGVTMGFKRVIIGICRDSGKENLLPFRVP